MHISLNLLVCICDTTLSFQILSVVGTSGGGKTTLLHLCAGLLDVEEGTVENSFKSQSFAFQEGRLLPWKNVIDNIALGLLAKGIDKKDAISQSQEIALKFGLEEDDFEKFPKDLSGGMKQRVSFARALVVNDVVNIQKRLIAIYQV